MPRSLQYGSLLLLALLTACGGSTTLPTPTVVTVSLPGAVQGQPYSYQLQGSGCVIVWSGQGLPSGLQVSATGLISGTPVTPGTVTLDITADCQ